MGFFNKNSLTEKELVDLSPEQFLSILVENTKTGQEIQKQQQQIHDKKLKKQILPQLMEAAQEGRESIDIELFSSDYPFSKDLLGYLKRAGVRIVCSRLISQGQSVIITFSWSEQMKIEHGDEEYISPF